jgi:fatty acid desaturase
MKHEMENDFFKPKFYGERLKKIKLKKRLKMVERFYNPIYVFYWLLIFVFGTILLPVITRINWLYYVFVCFDFLPLIVGKYYESLKKKFNNF